MRDLHTESKTNKPFPPEGLSGTHIEVCTLMSAVPGVGTHTGAPEIDL